MPLSPAPRGGGACWGGHILTGAPPLHLSLPGFVPLPHSPPISSGNLGRESGLHISLSSFLVARFPDGPSPATTPSPFFFNHFLHPPLSAPNLAPRTPPPPHPLHNPSMHPCTGCDRGTDSVWLSASHIRHRRRPSPSPPLVSSSSTSPEHGWAHPSTQERIFCNLQSAICARRADTGQRGNHLDGPTSYHIGTAAGCGIRRPCLRRHCDGAVTTLTSQRASVDCPVSLSVPLACSSSHRHGCCARGRERESGRGERGGDGKCRYL